jgi:hypothetical protein
MNPLCCKAYLEDHVSNKIKAIFLFMRIDECPFMWFVQQPLKDKNNKLCSTLFE